MFAAENGIHRTAHARIAEKGGAAREDLLVSGLNMRVSSDHCRNLAVKVATDSDFLAGCLPVDIYKNHRGLRAEAFDLCQRGGEGIFEDGLHEGAALHIEDRNFSLRGIEDDAAATGGSCGVVDGTKKAGFRGNVSGSFLLIPNMVAGRDDRHAGAKEIDRDFRGNAAPIG